MPSPQECFQKASLAGAQKARRSTSAALAAATLSGAHIAMGGCIAFIIGHAPALAATNPGLQRLAFGAVGFPLGLLMTVVTGGELVTANMAFVTMAAIEREISVYAMFKTLFVALIGNVIGSIIVVWLVYESKLLSGRHDLLELAMAKVAAPAEELVSKAILCNWLVSMGAYMASMATDLGGKAIGIWLPITAFAAAGLEHTVANVFFLGAGWAYGAEVSIVSILTNNLGWVLVGNMLGATLGVGLPLSASYGRLSGPRGVGYDNSL